MRFTNTSRQRVAMTTDDIRCIRFKDKQWKMKLGTLEHCSAELRKCSVLLSKNTSYQSVVSSGNSTFCKKRRLRKWKTPKNQYLSCILYSKRKKGNPFLTSSRHYGNLRKVPPFLTKSRIFLGFVFDIKSCKVKQLSWVIFISHESQKSWKETFLEFFQLFAFFFKVKKSRPFSSFFIWSFWADSCQIKAGISIFSPLNWQL